MNNKIFQQNSCIQGRLNLSICADSSNSDMEKDNFLTQARFDPKPFYPKKCVNFDKGEFATKQRKMYLTTSMSKTRLPHIYRGKNYVINFICSSF